MKRLSFKLPAPKQEIRGHKLILRAACYSNLLMIWRSIKRPRDIIATEVWGYITRTLLASLWMENSLDRGRSNRPRKFTLKPDLVYSLAHFTSCKTEVSVYGWYNKNNTIWEIIKIFTLRNSLTHLPSKMN